jgi:hypothetical protein
MTITAQDLITPIAKYVTSFIEEIGSSSASQNVYLLNYISLALRKLANLAYQVKISDALSLSADGDVTFTQAGLALDFYAMLRIIKPDGRSLNKRTSFEDTSGWWRESANMPINITGFTSAPPLAAGNYRLHYLKYPAKVTAVTDVIEFPEAGIMCLIYYTCAMVLESHPNLKDQTTYFYKMAKQNLKVSVLANTDARGTGSGGFVPSVSLVDTYFPEV